ncbi:MAG: phosphatase PAP2 family protein [Bacteroidales bacterium]|nr:phosphatase PAP2 family protein [Bacteroidales bacterium]MDD3700740.1 phosphatase PAP2 family protein [Bacteroidales bacterium]MDY0369368.1 phosphatase PAP2 family protein [Bacteroidales bacterium]
MNKRIENTTFSRFTLTNIGVNLMLVLVYLGWILRMGPIRSDHFFFISFYLLLFYGNEKTRKFILGFSIFMVYWIAYDSMRILPNYKISPVHIQEPYLLEKSLFGISLKGVVYTPNEYLAIVHTAFLDVVTGLFYLNWVPIPLAFGIYLYYKNKHLFTHYSLVFLLANLLGFVIYYLYPAAPPWYVDLYGFDLYTNVQGNSAGLARFDAITGVPVFASLYNKNANVLAAIPSLHAAYPVIVLYYGLQKKLGWVNVLFVLFMLGIWFSAVYSGHHYVIDVLLGALVALVTLGLFNLLSLNKWIKRKIDWFVRKI